VGDARTASRHYKSHQLDHCHIGERGGFACHHNRRKLLYSGSGSQDSEFPPLVRERQMFLQLWAAGTANTLLGLLLPPLLTTMYGPLSPVACCISFDALSGSVEEQKARLFVLERFSTDIFWYFVMSSVGSQLYRCGWEYWEQHRMVGWPLLRRAFYSPTELYGGPRLSFRFLTS
jgi:hypothetical protein